MDLTLLEKALEDDSNYNLIETNIQEIKDKKNNILQQLGIDRILLKFFGGIDKVTEWLFAWQAPRCKCKNKRKRHG